MAAACEVDSGALGGREQSRASKDFGDLHKRALENEQILIRRAVSQAVDSIRESCK